MPNTREKLIELLRTPIEITGGLMPPTAKMTQVFAEKIADHLIRNGVTLESYDCHWATEQAYKNGYEAGKPKWIPASEPPKKDGRFLVRNEYGMVYDQEYNCIYKGFGEKGEFDELTPYFMQDIGVTHWMPLPEAPKYEDGERKGNEG